jgi:hypothetical protein
MGVETSHEHDAEPTPRRFMIVTGTVFPASGNHFARTTWVAWLVDACSVHL